MAQLKDLIVNGPSRLIGDAYATTQATTTNDDKIATTAFVKNVVGGLDVASTGGSGKYIQSISETDGKISATAVTFPTIPESPTTYTSGNWTVQKYPSGLMIMSGMLSFTFSEWNSWGGTIYETNNYGEFQYPEAFKWNPQILVSASLSNNTGSWLEIVGSGSTTWTPKYYLCRPNTTNTGTAYVSLQVTGFWK